MRTLAYEHANAQRRLTRLMRKVDRIYRIVHATIPPPNSHVPDHAIIRFGEPTKET
jgi:hypothetical protein